MQDGKHCKVLPPENQTGLRDRQAAPCRTRGTAGDSRKTGALGPGGGRCAPQDARTVRSTVSIMNSSQWATASGWSMSSPRKAESV